jgi:hypothetical protein
MTDLEYKVIPEPTKYNVGVFLLNFHARQDGLSLRDAFEQDFDLMLGTALAPSEVLKEIMASSR